MDASPHVIRALIVCDRYKCDHLRDDFLRAAQNLQKKLTLELKTIHTASLESDGEEVRLALEKCVRQGCYHFVILEDTLVGSDSFREWTDCLHPAQCFLLTKTRIQTRLAMLAALEQVIPIPGVSSKAADRGRQRNAEIILQRFADLYCNDLELIDKKNALSRLNPHQEEVLELIRRLFPTDAQITIEPLDIGSQFGIGIFGHGHHRSHSLLLLIRRTNHVSVVLKIAPRNRIRFEIERFQQYIEARIPGLRYTYILNSEVVWNLGGIVYSFLGATSSPHFRGGERSSSVAFLGPLGQAIETALESIEETETDKLQKAIHAIYDSLSMLHRTPFPDQERIPSLFEQYNEVWSLEHKAKSWEEELAELLRPESRDWQPPIVEHLGLPCALPNPVHWVWHGRETKSHYLDMIPRRLGHGDLHAGNILIEHEQGWLLDFERSGPGPALQDYVELEVDLFTRMSDFKGNLGLVCTVALRLAQFRKPEAPLPFNPKSVFKSYPKVCRLLLLIEAIRTAAYRNIGYLLVEEYLWGLLLNTLFIIGQAAKHGESLRSFCARILGGVICLRLESLDGDGKWPPESLEPLFGSRGDEDE